jgi:hypothetical protein
LGGQDIAGGNVIAAAGGLGLGWRASEVFGVWSGVSTFLHDAVDQTVIDEFGDEVDVRSFGRMTVFDLVNLRVHVPMKGRIQPYAQGGGGVGWYTGGKANTRPVVGAARVGLGVDFWLGPMFSLGLGVDYRLLAVRKQLGHRLQSGLRLGIHW